MIIVHPEYAYLILEVNDLREKIADLIVEKDMLDNYICRDLELDYVLKIGFLEYKEIIANNNYKKSLRKLELIEESLEKKQEIQLDKIDKKVKKEFKEKDKLEEKMLKNVDLAIEMTSLELFDYDKIEEMNIQYFKLQKMYNPIFDMEFSEERDKFYKKIEKYYQKENDKKLSKLAEEYNPDDVFQDEFSNLKALKERYIQIESDLKKEIRKIKNSFPYNQKRILEDENLYRRKKNRINKEIEMINDKKKKIDKKIKKIVKDL